MPYTHFKVRVLSGSSTIYEFNSQLFFHPATTNQIYSASAYSSRGTPSLANSADILRPTSTVAETMRVRARESRNGKTIASKTVTGVTAGVRALDLVVPRATAGGSARLTMTHTDAAGLAKTVRKTVAVPKKRLR